MKPRPFRYTTCCVESQPADLEDLYEHDREIAFETFFRHVSLADVEQLPGYDRFGMRLRRDPCVRYYRSRWRGQPCYHIDHSSVDFIFTRTVNAAPLRPPWALAAGT